MHLVKHTLALVYGAANVHQVFRWYSEKRFQPQYGQVTRILVRKQAGHPDKIYVVDHLRFLFSNAVVLALMFWDFVGNLMGSMA